jgi:hypothetical protein
MCNFIRNGLQIFLIRNFPESENENVLNKVNGLIRDGLQVFKLCRRSARKVTDKQSTESSLPVSNHICNLNWYIRFVIISQKLFIDPVNPTTRLFSSLVSLLLWSDWYWWSLPLLDLHKGDSDVRVGFNFFTEPFWVSVSSRLLFDVTEFDQSVMEPYKFNEIVATADGHAEKPVNNFNSTNFIRGKYLQSELVYFFFNIIHPFRNYITTIIHWSR